MPSVPEVPQQFPDSVREAVKSFLTRNAGLKMHSTPEILAITHLWGKEGLAVVQPSASPFEPTLIDALTHVLIHPDFDALFHTDSNEGEFLYAILDPKDPSNQSEINRQFTFSFEGKQYDCRFAPPSDRLLAIARAFQRTSEEYDVVRQLEAYKFWQERDSLPEGMSDFFKTREPVSFFVKGIDNAPESHGMFRHLNRIMRYFDRQSPKIVIRDVVRKEKSKNHEPLRFVTGSFPSALSARLIDDIPLMLLDAAENAPPRLAFMYYYQTLEYAGHYFVEDKVRSKIRRLLRDPSAMESSDEHIAELHEIVVQHSQQDDTKIKGAIEECVDYRRVWREVAHDKEFFSSDASFEGGFRAKAIASKDMTESAFATNWVQSVYQSLTSIRNAIAHARERRQSHCILPTSANSDVIQRFLPVIGRIAEEVTIRG